MRDKWVLKHKFGIPATNLATKGDSITFSTPTIEGTIMRRNRPDFQDKHPWKAEVTEGTEGVDQSVIDGWYEEVYEPTGDLIPWRSTLRTRPSRALGRPS